MKNLIRQILKEEEFGMSHSDFDKLNGSDDGWDWAREIGIPYRFFDINVCWFSWYNEETGEDECDDGGSYFIKIPADIVHDIWDHEEGDEYMAGPGDEGSEVIDWCVSNGLMEEVSYDYVEYVREINKGEFCRAWGYWKEKDICGELTR